MADKIRNISVSRETLPGEVGGIGQKEKPGKEENVIQEKSQQFVEGVSEVVEGAEGAETTGEISEQVGESRKKVSSGGGGISPRGSVAQMDTKTPPSIEIMRIQVATQIRNEIRVLEKEVNRLIRGSGSFHPFKLNMLMSKIRELRDILSGLAYATTETIKGWWIKFVKGITT